MKRARKQTIPSIPYLIITAAIFYILPTLEKGTNFFMLILALGIPVFCFVSALLYGFKNGFHIFYPLIIGLLFLPTLFYSVQGSAFFYVMIYGAVAFAGIHLGSLIAARES
ncbi:hypothetical protein [Acetobacterium bakii]|uniref:Exosortase n=1 Tax=Acetobacterium bakii TaxID=52689 RepID=A0A0L6TZP4_9FIRM|nr:hypothetical protein [Acetobacterium bakii]KNZ41552.1 hypothetical protein AKG39_11210 [Acetobacterium bakii]